MADFPQFRYPPPPILTPYSIESLGWAMSGASLGTNLTSATSFAWPANNKAYYFPFTLRDFATALQLLFWVGGTSSGNIDVGIYDSQKNRIVSAGSTAMSATISTVQEINITDTPLHPGEYLLGVSCSTTGGFFMGTPSTGVADEAVLGQFPIYEEALGSVTLPDPCTPVYCTDASPKVVAVGIQFASVF